MLLPLDSSSDGEANLLRLGVWSEASAAAQPTMSFGVILSSNSGTFELEESWSCTALHLGAPWSYLVPGQQIFTEDDLKPVAES